MTANHSLSHLHYPNYDHEMIHYLLHSSFWGFAVNGNHSVNQQQTA